MTTDFAKVEMERAIDLRQDEEVVILDDRINPEPLRIRDTPLTGPMVWTRHTLKATDGVIKVGADCLGELEAVVATLRPNPFPIVLLQPSNFELRACTAMMAAAR